MALSMRAGFLLAAFALAPFAVADERRAQVNYMLHCQGCHLPATEGMQGRVPPMKDFVGWFLHSEEGREFLIRVPGVAQSALDDEELAELMNWILRNHSARQLPSDFRPFSAGEVGRLRGIPEPDPQAARQRILGDIARTVPEVGRALAEKPERARSERT